MDLQKIVKSSVPLQAEDIKSYLWMTLSGVAACHKVWVLHRVSQSTHVLYPFCTMKPRVYTARWNLFYP